MVQHPQGCLIKREQFAHLLHEGQIDLPEFQIGIDGPGDFVEGLNFSIALLQVAIASF